MNKILLISCLIFLIALVGCTSHQLNDELHDHSVEIEGKEMKILSVKQVADLWQIDSEILLDRIIKKFDLKGNYTINSILEDIRLEYKFSPAQIKDLAEEIKKQGEVNE